MGALFHLPRTIRLGLHPLDRQAIEAEIERLIALLDAIDGDPDLEEEPADDPLDVGEAQDADEILATLPIYGIDQSLGPINERQARRAWQRAIMAEGEATYRRQG